MKKLMTVLLLAATTVSFAQKRSPLRFGLKAGGSMSHLKVDGTTVSDEKNSFGLGAFAGGLLEISGPAGSKFKGQIEALYNMHNFKNTYTYSIFSQENKITLHQISVPVLLKYFVIPQLSINAGPSVNFNLAAENKYEQNTLGIITKGTYDYKDKKNLQGIQIGALLGATYYIHKGFFVDARYNYYFGSMTKDMLDDPSYRTSAIQLGVGYKF